MDVISARERRGKRSGLTFKKFQIKISIIDIHPFLYWMQQSGMPFLAKLHTQNQWTRSAKATKFFERMTDPKMALARTNKKTGVEDLLRLDIKCMRKRDWTMIETYIRLTWPNMRIGTVRRRNHMHQTAWRVEKVLAAK